MPKLPSDFPVSVRIGLGILALLAFLFFIFYLFWWGRMGTEPPTQSYIDRKLSKEKDTFVRQHFDLVDPNEAPEAIRSLARLGYQIMINTQIYAKQYAGDKLECTNCHFAGGDTTGGAGGGISLAGVAAKYPVYDARFKKVLDLPARINNCFMRSMNGKPLPRDSELMLALVTYLTWISKDIPIYSQVPWLGLKGLRTTYAGDPKNGERTYKIYCALCHKDDGQGGPNTPPLWGPSAFNREAGMAHAPTLAAFIFWNMPYMANTPVLTQEEAMDVAAYVLKQPR